MWVKAFRPLSQAPQGETFNGKQTVTTRRTKPVESHPKPRTAQHHRVKELAGCWSSGMRFIISVPCPLVWTSFIAERG